MPGFYPGGKFKAWRTIVKYKKEKKVKKQHSNSNIKGGETSLTESSQEDQLVIRGFQETFI